jgi:hypothetical protein
MTLYAQGSGSNSEFRGATLFDAPIINLQASQNDFDPAAMTEVSALLINAQAAGLSITGFARDRSGRYLKIVCAATSKNSFTLVNASGASLANHALNLGGSNIVMTAGSIVNLYCPVGGAGGSGWYIDSSSLAGGGGGSGGGIGSSINYAPASGADDPGTGVTGFVATAGSAGTGRVKITLTGNTTFASWPAGADGQQLFLTIAAGNFTLGLLTGGGAGAAFLAPASPFDFQLGDTIPLIYDAGLAKWLLTL